VAVNLRAPVLVSAAEPVTVTVDIADALGVGLSLQMMIAQGRIHASSVAAYTRIAEQLVAAARAAAGMVGR
jgi:hypothetical protein